MTTALEELLVRHVEAGTVPGAIGLLGADDAGDPEVVAVGVTAVDGPPLREDAIVRIQSMTKAVTAVSVLRLVEAGRITLDDSVEAWLPELGGRRVLSSPSAELDDTVPAVRPITVRHLLTNTSGYGMVIEPSPLADAMSANATEAGAAPFAGSADDWLARLAGLPLAFQPGEGWRYHHSYAVLGIMVARLTGRPFGEHLAEDLFGPLGMTDTGPWVPETDLDRLPAAYRHDGERLVETEPAGGGAYAGVPAVDVSHGELVSTARDYHRFLRALGSDDTSAGGPLVSPRHRVLMTTDQVPDRVKTPESFFPGFWDATGWGSGVGIVTSGAHRGRYGWSGGQGTDFFVDPDGTVGILLTQVELGEHVWPLVEEFQALHTAGTTTATAPGDEFDRGRRSVGP